MAHATIKGKNFTWWHFRQLAEEDFHTLETEFAFHALDFDDLRDDGELSKVDEYDDYIFGIINVPHFDSATKMIRKKNLVIFIGEHFAVTVTRDPIDAVERFFARASKSEGMQKDVLHRSTGYFLYKLLDYVFRDAKVELRELVRESEHVEAHVYDSHTRVTTTRLGMLRRNVLQMRQMIDPQRILIMHYVNAGKPFVGKDLRIFFDDIQDNLDSMGIVLENLKLTVDGLFEMNESFLSHRTNEIIRILTIISVVLMPPTLITSYYGMNIDALPLSESVVAVSVVIAVSIFAFWIMITYLDRRR